VVTDVPTGITVDTQKGSPLRHKMLQDTHRLSMAFP
jgi:hypothetical protein